MKTKGRKILHWEFNFRKLVLLVLALWLGSRIYMLYREPQAIDMAQIPNRTSSEIDKEELMSFLPVWSDYVQQNISDVGRQAVSLSSGKPEDNLSKQAAEWLLRRNWRPARFFYVEQRLRVILKTIEYRQQSEKMIQSLTRQLSDLQRKQAETNNFNSQIASLSNSIENLIREQQSRVNIEKVTPQELELVTPLHAHLWETLEGRQLDTEIP